MQCDLQGAAATLRAHRHLSGVPRSMSRPPKIRSRERSRGQSIVEFALILPVLILLVLVTLDFGRLFMSYITLTNTTRVAANYGATNPGSFTGTPVTTAYDALVDRESVGLNCDLQADGGGNSPPIPTFPTGTGLSGTSVAEMTCDFSLITPFMTQFFGGPLAVSARAEFPIRTGAIANIGGSTVLPPPGSPQADFDFTGVSGGTVNGAGNVSGSGTVTVNVTNTSTNAQTWDWDWGDGGLHDFGSAPAAHTYSADGTYSVILTVRNTVDTSSRTRTVTVNSVPVPPPVAGFYGMPVAGPPRYTEGGGSTGTPIRGSLPLVVDFTNTSNGTAYSWNFGDGTAASTGVSPQHQYSTLGVFSVTLAVTAPTGGSPITRTGYITTGCVVPNFTGTSTSAADPSWTGAGFSGSTRFHAVGAPGIGSPNPPGLPRKIVSQSPLVGGSFIPATPKGPNSWECAGDIVLDYLP